MSLVVANWKMNGSLSLCEQFKTQFALSPINKVEIVLCPPAPYLAQFANSSIVLGAQNVHQELSGAFTGELSVAMALEFGAKYVLVGHSERRQLYAETNDLVCKKVQTIQQQGLTPIVCVGESAAEFAAQQSFAAVQAQLEKIVAICDLDNLIIAYEPVWAIGTGLTATPQIAQNMHAFIRNNILGSRKNKIIYGGSVKADNALSLCAQHDIDGALVGGASLNVDGFVSICKAFVK
jgi:triosephosphate isomerase